MKLTENQRGTLAVVVGLSPMFLFLGSLFLRFYVITGLEGSEKFQTFLGWTFYCEIILIALTLMSGMFAMNLIRIKD